MGAGRSASLEPVVVRSWAPSSSQREAPCWVGGNLCPLLIQAFAPPSAAGPLALSPPQSVREPAPLLVSMHVSFLLLDSLLLTECKMHYNKKKWHFVIEITCPQIHMYPYCQHTRTICSLL